MLFIGIFLLFRIYFVVFRNFCRCFPENLEKRDSRQKDSPMLETCSPYFELSFAIFKHCPPSSRKKKSCLFLKSEDANQLKTEIIFSTRSIGYPLPQHTPIVEVPEEDRARVGYFTCAGSIGLSWRWPCIGTTRLK